MSIVKPKKKFFKYSQDDLEKAVEAVRVFKMKIREAERKYNVPHSTLINKLKDRYPMERKMGPGTTIPKPEEEMLELFLISSAKKGFHVSKRRLMLLAQEICKKKMGKKLFELFLKRHPKISKRHSATISSARAAVTEASIRIWHGNLKAYLEEEYAAHTDLLDDPARILNSDESGFMLNPKTGVVLGPTGQKNLYEIAAGQEKEQITVLLTISADGTIFPPLVVLPFERVPAKVAENYNGDWSFGNSKSGWMTSEVYLGYIQNALLPSLKAKGVKFPVLYIVDGHKSHLSQSVAEFCDANDIIIYSLRPNATHIIQPADVSVFGCLKHHWNETVEDFKAENRYEPITKAKFGKLLESSLLKVSSESVRNGFKKCGIFPFNADNIDFSRCMTDKSRTDEALKPTFKPNFTYVDLMYIESCMNHGRAKEFRRTYDEKKDWEGDESAKELYKVWWKLRSRIQKDTTESPPGTQLILVNEPAQSLSDVQPTVSYQPVLCSPNTQPANPLPTAQSSGTQDVSPNFYDKVLLPADTPPCKKKSRKIKFPQGIGARRWLKYYEDLKKEGEAEKEKKLQKEIEKSRKKQEMEKKKEERKRRQEEEKQKAKQNKKPKLQFLSSDSEDEEAELEGSLTDSSGGAWDEKGTSNDEAEVNEEEFWEGRTDAQEKDWVLVKFTGKKGPLYYIGEVQSRQSSKVNVKFLKKKRENTFVFPTVVDESLVDLDNIKKVLPVPKERRGYYYFNLNFPANIVVV